MEVIEKLRAAIHLSFEEAGCLFDAMLDGRMEEGQIEEVLLLLSDKGETEEEIAGAAQVAPCPPDPVPPLLRKAPRHGRHGRRR